MIEVLWLMTCHLTLSLCSIKNEATRTQGLIIHKKTNKQLNQGKLSINYLINDVLYYRKCKDPDLLHVGKKRAQQGAEKTVVIFRRT